MHRDCDCCPYLRCYGGSSIEWVEIPTLTSCVNGSDVVGRLLRRDAANFTDVPGDASSCFYQWTDNAVDAGQDRSVDFGPPINAVNYRRQNNIVIARFQPASNGTLDIILIQRWVTTNGYTRPGFSSSLDRGERTTTYRITNVRSLDGVYTIDKVSETDLWQLAGTSNAGTFPYCSTPSTVTAKFCKSPEISPCSGCFNWESASIAGSVPHDGPRGCDTYPSVDGTYAFGSFRPLSPGSPTPCQVFRTVHFFRCADNVSSSRVDINVSIFKNGFVIPTSIGGVTVPFPYYAISTSIRVIVVVQYFSSGLTWNDQHYYVQDFQNCPDGVQPVPYVTTVRAAEAGLTPDLGSSPPASVSINW